MNPLFQKYYIVKIFSKGFIEAELLDKAIAIPDAPQHVPALLPESMTEREVSRQKYPRIGNCPLYSIFCVLMIVSEYCSRLCQRLFLFPPTHPHFQQKLLTANCSTRRMTVLKLINSTTYKCFTKCLTKKSDTTVIRDKSQQ